MINFKLKEIDKIVPVGKEPNLSLSWFWLTGGDLWLKFGNQTIYEYTEDALKYFGGKPTPYNDYYIVRFLEDFTELFEKISISVPLYFYKLTENLQQFKNDAQKWLDIYDTEKDDNDFYFNKYDKLISWTYERLFDSSHLIGGPNLSFFRHKNKIRIVWDTEYNLDNGSVLWTAKNGSFEMNYSDFIAEVKIFGQNFFKEMDKQVEYTLAKEWREITVDKTHLIKEHKERENEFNKNLFFLEQDIKDDNDWNVIKQLCEQMKNELK